MKVGFKSTGIKENQRRDQSKYFTEIKKTIEK